MASPSESVRVVAVELVIKYVQHPFPRVRRLAAEALFVVVTSMQIGDHLESVEAEAEQILVDTDWNLSVADLKPVIDKLSTLLNQLIKQ